MFSLKLYNTLTRQKEICNSASRKLRLYTCGPTVYNFAHIGNFRTYIFEDLLRRTIQFLGYEVVQVMNLTDVDDKTIKGAIEAGISLDEYTKPFKQAFFEDLKTLNIQPAEYYPAATDYIDAMIEMIQKLIDKKCAYRGVDGSIYFSIRSFPRYGCLSHLDLQGLKEGASDRICHDEYDKEIAADFVLWKSYDSSRDGKIYWESPFGRGRPGWHIECSAMSMALLGDSIDIHCGGVDNMFPHHENEIAQSESCTEKRFVQVWMHAEHLMVDNKKMSKSLGNFYTLRDLIEKGYTGRQIRFVLVQTHYRTSLNFTFLSLDASKNSLQRIDDFIKKLMAFSSDFSSDEITNKDPLFYDKLKNFQNRFQEALADDLNLSQALAQLFELIRFINTGLDKNIYDIENIEKVLELLKQWDRVLGFIFAPKQLTETTIPEELLALLDQRQKARREKNYVLADHFRNEIYARGYLIEDGVEGSFLKKY